VPFRGVLLGLTLVVGFALFIPYLTDIKHGYIPGGPINGASILALIILLGPLNGLLLWRWRSKGLSRQEILTAYGMVLLTASIVGWGYIGWATVLITAGQYFASPENRWAELILPYVPPWMQVNEPIAVRWLWEGIPEGTAVPWSVWQSPLLVWGTVAFCIFAGSFCLLALVRRDWIEGQRLAFPLAQIPLELVGSRGIPGLALLRLPLFWIGFALAFGHGLVGLLQAYYPAVPYHNLRWAVGQAINPNSIPWGPLHRVQFNVTLLAVGIMCLVPTEVSLSLWLFNLLYFGTLVACAMVGLTGQAGARYDFSPQTFLSFQQGGALVGFGVFVLWQSRHAIVGAVKSWWDASYRRDDPLELLRPRYALLGLIGSTLVLGAIAHAAGAQLHRLLILLFIFYTTALSLTRVIAAAGTNHVECGPPLRYLLDYGLGTRGVRPGTFVVLNQLDAIFMTDMANGFMHYAANDMKIFHSARLRGTTVVVTLAGAVLVMLALGSLARLYTNYQLGVSQYNVWVADEVPRWEWGDMANELQNPRGPSWMGVIATVSGGVLASVLGLLQMHVSWWRLSPVGVVSPQWGLNRYIWANAFIGWALVTIVYRFGGLRLYQRLRPAFFGIFMGGMMSMFVANGARLLFGGPGAG